MEENSLPFISDGEIVRIRFSLATPKEIVSWNLSLLNYLFISPFHFIIEIIFSLGLFSFEWLKHNTFTAPPLILVPRGWVISVFFGCFFGVVLASTTRKWNDSPSVYENYFWFTRDYDLARFYPKIWIVMTGLESLIFLCINSFCDANWHFSIF